MATTLTESIRLAVAAALADNIKTVFRSLSLPDIPVEAVDHKSDPRRTDVLPRIFVATQGFASTGERIGGEATYEDRDYGILIIHGVKSKTQQTNVVAWGNQVNDCICKVLEDQWDIAIASLPDGKINQIRVLRGTVDPLATQAESNLVHWGELEAVVQITRQLQTHGGE